MKDKSKDISSIDTHMESTHGKNKQETVPNLPSKENINTFHEIEELTCKYCGFEAETGEALKNHMISEHPSSNELSVISLLLWIVK